MVFLPEMDSDRKSFEVRVVYTPRDEDELERSTAKKT